MLANNSATESGGFTAEEPKTWYGMPAYANTDGKVVVFFQNSESSATGTRP